MKEGGEAVAASRHCRYNLRPKYSTQGRDVHLERVLLHHNSWPDPLKQFVLGHQASTLFHQHQQQGKRLGTDTDGFSVNEQLAITRVDDKAPKHQRLKFGWDVHQDLFDELVRQSRSSGDRFQKLFRTSSATSQGLNGRLDRYFSRGEFDPGLELDVES